MDMGELEHTERGEELLKLLKVGEIVEAGKPDKGSTRDSSIDSTDSLKWLQVSSNEKTE